MKYRHVGALALGIAVSAAAPAAESNKLGALFAARFKAPVLLFHGDRDLNVDVDQSKTMDAALRRAGKQSTLVVFPKLDHQLDDNDARTRMLGEADAFLHRAMKM